MVASLVSGGSCRVGWLAPLISGGRVGTVGWVLLELVVGGWEEKRTVRKVRGYQILGNVGRQMGTHIKPCRRVGNHIRIGCT